MVEDLHVLRNDEVDLEALEDYDAFVLSPGPGLPSEAGSLMPLLKKYAGRRPILGVCLGHQAIAEFLGGRLSNLDEVIHGHATQLDVLEPDHVLFRDIDMPMEVGHYHSWVVEEQGLPEEVEMLARNEDGLNMIIHHADLGLTGLQFHPESILTPQGKQLLNNWLEHLAKPYLRKVQGSQINIAIDGHSACGKSTVAKRLAGELGYIYVDSGSMYRAVALYALQHGLAEGKTVDAEGLKHHINEVDVRLKRRADGRVVTTLNGEDVEEHIRNMRVSAVVSPVSTIPEVRTKLVELQQVMAREGGIIMDGRDIGTVVLPEAELKIFLTASLEERGRRRWAELADRGTQLSMDEVLDNLRERDRIDSTRDVSPLTQAEDAVYVDNSEMDADSTLSHLKGLVERVLDGVGA
jgi:cytidylate kinase